MNRHLACLLASLSCLMPVAVHGEGYWDRRLWIAMDGSPNKLATDGDGRLLMAGKPSLSVFNLEHVGTTVGSWDGHRWTPISKSQPSAVIGSAGITWLAGVPSLDSVTQVNAAGDSITLPPVDGQVRALTMDGAGLIAGGQFVTGPGNTATNVARWNGTAWEPLGTGLPGKVIKLSATEGGLYAGLEGTLELPTSVWHWDGTSWSQLGTIPGENPPMRQISDLIWHNGKLVASLSSLKFSTNAVVLSWSGNQWLPSGAPTLTGSASSLAVFQGNLYAAGSFRMENFIGSFGVARLLGGALTQDQWQPLRFAPGGVHGRGAALAATRDELFLISALPSDFGLATGDANYGLWQFDGHDWWLHSNGLYAFESVSDLQPSPAGMVLAVTGGTATYPGRYGFLWDGSFLKKLGIIQSEPGATLVLGSRMIPTPTQVYRQASRSPAAAAGKNLLARLEGTNWVAATAPMTLSLTKASPLAADGETIYVSGRDDAADGNPVAVARWQGSWERLGGYFGDGTLNALAVLDGQPVAGGSFKSIGGQSVTNLARWDGITWQPVTPAPDGPVSAFARRGNGVVVVGSFTSIGDLAAPGVALWTTAGWQSLADGLGLVVPSAVAVREDGTLAVSGSTQGTSEVWLRHGTNWQLIGRAFVSGTVNALQWEGQDLFVGGNFFGMADGESGRFAIWHEPSPQLAVRRLPKQMYRLHWTGAYPGASVLEIGSSPDQFTPWRTNFPMDLHRDFTNQPAPGSTQEFYRARLTE